MLFVSFHSTLWKTINIKSFQMLTAKFMDWNPQQSFFKLTMSHPCKTVTALFTLQKAGVKWFTEAP